MPTHGWRSRPALAPWRRPWLRIATGGGSGIVPCPQLQTRLGASKPRFGKATLGTHYNIFAWRPTCAQKSTTSPSPSHTLHTLHIRGSRAPHPLTHPLPRRKTRCAVKAPPFRKNWPCLDYCRGHFPTENHCPRHNPTRPSCAHSQRSTSMACSSPANAFERPASGCTGRESPGEHFCLQGRLVRAPCSTCDRKASASRQTACTRCTHGVHMVCTL